MAAYPWVNFKRMTVRVPWWIVLSVALLVALFRLVRFALRRRRVILSAAVFVLLLDAYERFGCLPLLLAAVVVAAGAFV